MSLVNLKRDNGSPILSQEQIKKIEKYPKEIQYYLAQMILQKGFDEVFSEIDTFLPSKTMIRNMSIFDSGRYEQYLNSRYYTQKLESVKGIFGRCRDCNNDEVVYYEKQTRSADEPMTIFITCTSCNYKWTR